MNKEGKTNPDLFLLLLQKDVRKFIENSMSIPRKEKEEQGFNKVVVDFQIGSGGNITLESVAIKAFSETSNFIMFYIKKDGFYRNNSLSDEDLELILKLPDVMNEPYNDYDNVYYDLFSIPNKKTLDEQLKEAIECENYELAQQLKNKIDAKL